MSGPVQFWKSAGGQQAVSPRTALRDWYRTPLGQRLLRIERGQLDAILPDLFGYHLVQVGRVPDEDFTGASRIRHRMVVDLAPVEPEEAPQAERFFARADALPISPDSIDVLVLPHVLEFEHSPHEVLREAERALIPEGHLVVLGFNPWSLWMLWHLALGWRGAVPWCGHFYSSIRVRDWLALLGFDMLLTRYYFYQPPMHYEPSMRRQRLSERVGQRLWPGLGAAYLILARKRVTTLTPIRPRWRPQRRLAPAGIPSPE